MKKLIETELNKNEQELEQRLRILLTCLQKAIDVMIQGRVKPSFLDGLNGVILQIKSKNPIIDIHEFENSLKIQQKMGVVCSDPLEKLVVIIEVGDLDLFIQTYLTMKSLEKNAKLLLPDEYYDHISFIPTSVKLLNIAQEHNQSEIAEFLRNLSEGKDPILLLRDSLSDNLITAPDDKPIDLSKSIELLEASLNKQEWIDEFNLAIEWAARFDQQEAIKKIIHVFEVTKPGNDMKERFLNYVTIAAVSAAENLHLRCLDVLIGHDSVSANLKVKTINSENLKRHIIKRSDKSLFQKYDQYLRWNITDLTDAVAIPKENKIMIESVFERLIAQNEKLNRPSSEIAKLNDQAWHQYSILTKQKKVRCYQRIPESVMTLAKSKAIISYNLLHRAKGEFSDYEHLPKDSEEKKTFDLLMQNCWHLESCLYYHYGLQVFSEPYPSITYHSPNTLPFNRTPIELNRLPTTEIGKMARKSLPSFFYFLNAEMVSRLFALNSHEDYSDWSASKKIMNVKAWPDEFKTQTQKRRIKHVEKLFRAFHQIPDHKSDPNQTVHELIRDVINSHDRLPAELIKIYIDSLTNPKRPKPQELNLWQAFCANYIEVVNHIQNHVEKEKHPSNFNYHLEVVSLLDTMANAENPREEMGSSKNKTPQSVCMKKIIKGKLTTFQSIHSITSSRSEKLSSSKSEEKNTGPGQKYP